MKKLLPVVLVLLLAPSMAFSQQFLQVSSLKGKIEIRSASAKAFTVLNSTNRQVQAGDEIRTGPGASVVLTLPDSSFMVVSENSHVVIRDFTSGTIRSTINQILGKVQFHIEKVGGRPNPYRVETPTALIAVRGTIFDVWVDSGSTEVRCLDGQVAVETVGLPDREVILSPDMHTLVNAKQYPMTPAGIDVDLAPSRTLKVVKKGPENSNGSLDPRALEALIRDNDRSTRPSDRYNSPASQTDSNVMRAKPSMTYPE